MKYTVILVAVGLLVAGFFAVSNRGPSEPQISPSDSGSATKSPTTGKDSYRLIVLADTVSLKHGGTSKVVHGTVEVSEGDEVSTSASGRARLSWPNGTITTLEEDSKILIQQLSDGGNKSRINLLAGDIWSKVSRILGSGEYYEVQTQETVAAVRGTIFRTTYRNRRTRVQGVDRVVRVMLKKSDGSADESTGVDVKEENQVDLDANVSGTRRLKARRLTASELKDRIYDRIRRERDLDDAGIIRTITSPTPSKTPTPTPTRTPSPTPTSTPQPTTTATATPTATVIPTVIPTLSPTPIPTPTPLPPVTLERAFPSIISAGQTFLLEGTNFQDSRHISRIQSVSVGGQLAGDFAVFIGGTQMNVQPAQLSPGTYNITVITKDGQSVTLFAGVTIQ